MCQPIPPPQQIKPSLNALAEMTGAKTFYLIGNDYVWPQKSNEAAKGYIAQLGGEVVGEEYAPLGPGNKFDDAVTRIKAAAPDLVLVTLVGGDNVNFNRTFAGFGLDKSITRLSLLLEELTLLGIGAENSTNLYSCMSYFSAVESPEERGLQAALCRRDGGRCPTAFDDRRGCLFGHELRRRAVREGGQQRRSGGDGGIRGPGIPHGNWHRDDDEPSRQQGHVSGRVHGRRIQDHPDLPSSGARGDVYRVNACANVCSYRRR